jgi:hypothetical protein
MTSLLIPSFYGWALILIVFAYTIYLVRSGSLSAHLAINWIIAELAFMGIMYFEGLRVHIREYMGEERAAYSLLVVGAIWFIYLMLGTLTRISTLTTKLKEINQELALVRERLDRAERRPQHAQSSAEVETETGVKTPLRISTP